MIISAIFLILLCTPVYLDNRDPARTIKISIEEFIKTGLRLKTLSNAVRKLIGLPNTRFGHSQTCESCRYVVDSVLQFRRSGANRNEMVKLIKALCIVFFDGNKVGCKGRSENEVDAILYMIDNRKNLTAARVCSIHFQKDGCIDPDYYEWHVNIPKRNASESIQINHKPPTNESLKILHLTDIHFDPEYMPGSNAKCNEPLCCRGGKPDKPENAAGYWGDYNICDMPWHSVLNLMDQIEQQHSQIDFVYYTGDVISHAAWMTSKQSNKHDIGRILDLFAKRFNSTIVYPILGNHEPHPSNYYAPDNVSDSVSSKWLYDFVAEDWSKWLPNDTKQTISHGGFYTVLVKKGFRIIGINSNVCYLTNMWLYYDDIDPYGQLQWLADTLAKAEKNGEMVHILSHIPPGSLECWRPWRNEFNRIVRRFCNTIKAQFNGHIHMDEIRVFLNEKKDNAINVAYIGGSFATYYGMNPSYRIYDMDSSTFRIQDYDEWMYNLTSANMRGNTPPEWFKLYSFKEAYGLNSTSNRDLFDLIRRMKNDPQKKLMKQYFRFKFRDSAANTDKGCDDKCLDKLLCFIYSMNYEDAMKCEEGDTSTRLLF